MKNRTQGAPPWRPLFHADWESVVMIHLEVDPAPLQAATPFPVETFGGQAFVTLVAFTLRKMRPAVGGRWTARLLAPIATHEFLNVRTYVNVGGSPGIHFLAEWLPNRISAWLGPRTYGLPYRLGDNRYDHRPDDNRFEGRVTDARTGDRIHYRAHMPRPDRPPAGATPGTRDFFLRERYTAFNRKARRSLRFEVAHPPWPMRPLEAEIDETALLERNWPFLKHARVCGADFCSGLPDVEMSGPRRLRGSTASPGNQLETDSGHPARTCRPTTRGSG